MRYYVTIWSNLGEVEVPEKHGEMSAEQFWVFLILDALEGPNQPHVAQLSVHPYGWDMKKYREKG